MKRFKVHINLIFLLANLIELKTLVNKSFFRFLFGPILYEIFGFKQPILTISAVQVRGWRGLGHGQSHAVSASYLYCDYQSLSFFRWKCHDVVLSMDVQTLLMRRKRYQYMKYHTGTTIQRSRKAGERNGSHLFNARETTGRQLSSLVYVHNILRRIASFMSLRRVER